LSFFFAKYKNEDLRNAIIGIPNRLTMISVDKKSKLHWMDNVIGHMETKIEMNRKEIIDFLKMTKSTYALVQIPHGDNLGQYLMMLVNESSLKFEDIAKN
jgi:hypothetical protein